MTLPRATADMLHVVVEASRTALGATDWADYIGLACDLPALLRENGLQQTADFLRHQSDRKTGAERLLRDWLGSTNTALSVAALLPGTSARARSLAARRSHPQYPLASTLALGEAQRIKRSCEAVAVVLANTPHAGPAGRTVPPSAADAGTTGDSPAAHMFDSRNPGEHDPREHLGLLWRFGGLPARFEDKAHRDRYKADHIQDLVTRGNKGSNSVHRRHYTLAYQRWLKWAEAIGATRSLKVESRLLLGLGGASVHETQVLLHPVNGLPYIPGSTLKGALKAWLQARIDGLPDSQQDEAEELQALIAPMFGTVLEADGGGEAGLLAIHDAWWEPQGGPLVREVETPHHSAYYSGTQPTPTAFDSPTPVAQLAIIGRFRVCVSEEGIGREWADKLADWLCLALGDTERGGLGGKAFSAGYGRLIRVEPAAVKGASRKKSRPSGS